MTSPLLDRFVIDEAVVTLGALTLRLHKPRSAEDLISEEDFARDERLPYWADLWPSAHVLATRVLAEADPAWRALELGCGLGLATLAASARGLYVTATDYYDDALAFVGHNASRNGLPAPTLRHADWRDWPADLGGFDLVLGADILYERPMGPQVAGVLARVLAPNGRAWITDPGRVGAEPFVEACTMLGLRVQATTHQHPDAPPRPITLYEVTRADPHSASA
jgi:ETFB lysine methyltransferase